MHAARAVSGSKQLSSYEKLQSRLVPEANCYTAVIDACSRGGQWQIAVELLRAMPQQGIKADVKCYSAAIDACSDSGQWQQAVDLLREMQQQLLVPDIRACNRTIMLVSEEATGS
jgi:pentatricopeptide repeat protein